MSALLSSFALFACAWATHVVWWRIRLPRHQMVALAGVFALVPVVVGALWLALGLPAVVMPRDLPGIGLFYVGGLGCYLIAYTGVEETSPSLAVIRSLEDAGPAGRSPEELGSVVTDRNFVAPRIEALKRDGMIVPAGEGYVLSPRGRQTVRTSLLLSRIFNIRAHA